MWATWLQMTLRKLPNPPPPELPRRAADSHPIEPLPVPAQPCTEDEAVDEPA